MSGAISWWDLAKPIKSSASDRWQKYVHRYFVWFCWHYHTPQLVGPEPTPNTFWIVAYMYLMLKPVEQLLTSHFYCVTVSLGWNHQRHQRCRMTTGMLFWSVKLNRTILTCDLDDHSECVWRSRQNKHEDSCVMCELLFTELQITELEKERLEMTFFWR